MMNPHVLHRNPYLPRERPEETTLAHIVRRTEEAEWTGILDKEFHQTEPYHQTIGVYAAADTVKPAEIADILTKIVRQINEIPRTPMYYFGSYLRPDAIIPLQASALARKHINIRMEYPSPDSLRSSICHFDIIQEGIDRSMC